MGIFVQGRKINTSEPIGTFIGIPSDMHLVECPNVMGYLRSDAQSSTFLPFVGEWCHAQ